jgi:hypothetical protein
MAALMGLIDDSLMFIEHRAACEKIKQSIRERQEKRTKGAERVLPVSFIVPIVAGRARSVYYALGPELVPMPPAKARISRRQ